MADAARFSRIFFSLVLGALILTFSINLAVDPLGLFGMPTWAGFNAEKTQYQKYLRMAKPHAVRMLKPSGLILGTSRAENVDPGHPGWHPDAQPVYNMAIQSSRIHEVLRNLQHAQAQQPLAQVVLFLDDFMFDPRTVSEEGFKESRLDREPTPRINLAWLDDLIMALLSYDALAESITTVSSQGQQVAVLYLANGAHDPTRLQGAVDQKGGHRKMFLEQARPAGRGFSGDDSAPYEAFRALLDFCRKHNIDLRLAINPMHAHMLELYWLNGSWEALENWKRRLVTIVEQEAADSPAAKPFPLWDFADYNSITMESVPPLGDAKTRMRWYWESSHFKTATGHLMFDQVLGTRSFASASPEYFGRQIGADNIDAYLRSIRDRHTRYAATHQVDIAEITTRRAAILQPRSVSQ